jgi:hypothetical protein
MADRLDFDGSGDYRSVIETDGVLVDLQLDPGALLKGDVEPVVEIDDGHAVSLRLIAPVAEVEARRDRFLWRLEASRRVPDPRIVLDPLREDLAIELPSVMARARAATEPAEHAVRTISALQTMRLATPESRDPAFVEEAKAILPPESPLWALAPELIGYVASFEERPAAGAFLHAVAERNPDAEIRKSALVMGYMRAYREGDLDMARAFIARLAADFPDAPENGTAQKVLSEMTRTPEAGSGSPPHVHP